jgi:hypothetical protein
MESPEIIGFLFQHCFPENSACFQSPDIQEKNAIHLFTMKANRTCGWMGDVNQMVVLWWV